jgi:ABC-type branched-subunit amino acid transport system substrate-binding protein
LAAVTNAAKAAGVQCDTSSVISDRPYEAIVKAAEDKGCDLIMMASHGRSGMSGVLLGSETQKVLTHRHTVPSTGKQELKILAAEEQPAGCGNRFTHFGGACRSRPGENR